MRGESEDGGGGRKARKKEGRQEERKKGRREGRKSHLAKDWLYPALWEFLFSMNFHYDLGKPGVRLTYLQMGKWVICLSHRINDRAGS